MTIKVKYSSAYEAKRKRIQRLPQFIPGMVEGHIKRDLLEIRDMFHDGIKDDTFGLERLAESTKSRKSSKGYPRPSAPLHGKGDMELNRSYMNMLIMRRTSKGWKLLPSTKRHWSGKITLRELFVIHEHGAKIKRGNTIIQLKPRPAFLLAYRRWMIKRRQADKALEVRKALTKFVVSGDKALIKRIEDFKNRT